MAMRSWYSAVFPALAASAAATTTSGRAGDEKRSDEPKPYKSAETDRAELG